jgi:hypothetical protein
LLAIEMASVVQIAKARIQRVMQASAVALGLVACAVPRAEEPPTRMIPAARTLSSTVEPVESRCAEAFRTFDRDRDGQISLEELADRIEPSLNADLVFRQRDRDLDGFLIEREFCVRLGATTIGETPVEEPSTSD